MTHVTAAPRRFAAVTASLLLAHAIVGGFADGAAFPLAVDPDGPIPEEVDDLFPEEVCVLSDRLDTEYCVEIEPLLPPLPDLPPLPV